jgi:hypothetical protein
MNLHIITSFLSLHLQIFSFIYTLRPSIPFYVVISAVWEYIVVVEIYLEVLMDLYVLSLSDYEELAERILFIFCIQKFIHPRSVPYDSEHTRFKEQSPFQWKSVQKITVIWLVAKGYDYI